MADLDLHLHSSVSDGRHSPAEVVRRAAAAGLTLISLTDHDNVDGIPEAIEAAGQIPGLTVIPGVEVSTDDPDTGAEVHMLGYFVDYKDAALRSMLAASRDSRENRAKRMVAKLCRMGMPIEWSRVQQIAGPGTIGRPHIARALLEKGYISTMREAFEKYIANGCPAYIDREKIDPAGAAALILKAGGIPVMAHPYVSKEPEKIIAGLKKQGLAGIEAYYGEYNPEEIRHLACLAEKFDLLATGGSDYHGLAETSDARIGRINIPPEAAAKLHDLAKSRLGTRTDNPR